MNIEITDTKAIINDANTLLEDVVELESVKDSIEYILNEIKEYWEQTQEDAAAFYEDLRKNVDTLSELLKCNKEFATAISEYAESQEKVSQNSIN